MALVIDKRKFGFMKEAEAAEYIGQPVAELRAMVKRGQILEYRLSPSSRMRRYSVAELDIVSGKITVEEKPKTKRPSLFVYFIQAGENGPIKIGIAGSIESRIASLQTAHYEPLRLLGFVEQKEVTEKELHDRFREHRIRGEWFHPVESIFAFIENNTWKSESRK